MTKFNIVYLPLDERPCNYHFAQRIAMGTEVRLRKPSPEVLGDKKIPADYDKVRKYLLDNATTANAYIVSLDMLLYGGIVPSRLHQLDEDELTARLDVLDEIKRINPAVKIYAFQLIMRCPCYSSSDEEPDYYEYCGREIFLTGQVKHKLELGLVTQDEAQELLGQYAEKIGDNLIDFEQRRKVNRNMLVKAVKKLHHAIDFLVIPQDDSAPYGYTSMDRELIKKQLADNHLDEVAMYPGADEVGMTLLARAVCEYKNVSPRIHCIYCHEKSPYIIPLYEDRPLKDTLPFQIGTAGCRFADGKEDADIMLYLNYPSQQPVDESSLPSVGYGERDLVTFCNKMVEDIKNGKIVALADGAYCNGGDLELLKLLTERTDFFNLSAYAGWNTSSNTLGTVICQAVVVFLFGKSKWQDKFLAERLYEDVGYCGFARRYIVNNLLSQHGYNYFNAGGKKGKVAGIVRQVLSHHIESNFPDVYSRYRLARCQMPWRRMFEVDLTVKKVEQ